MSLVDPNYELIDPNPDLHASFLQFNEMFFEGKLIACEVVWSKRLTQCAGLCHFQPRSGYCSIRLSEPLLKLRPRKDFIETLLHEMIHAYLFLTSRVMDRDGHGPNFQYHMHRINNLAGTRITIYHSFHAEVAHYKQHWWRCEGRCRDMKPFYGWVKRSMNRAPSKNDTWWDQHQKTCGGTFVKVKEPEKQQKEPPTPKTKKRPLEDTKTPTIDSIWGKGQKLGDGNAGKKPIVTSDPTSWGKGQKLGGDIENKKQIITGNPSSWGKGYRLGGDTKDQDDDDDCVVVFVKQK